MYKVLGNYFSFFLANLVWQRRTVAPIPADRAGEDPDDSPSGRLGLTGQCKKSPTWVRNLDAWAILIYRQVVGR